MFEAIPNLDNPEKEEYAGAFVTCWVNSIDLNSALSKAKGFINDEGWEVIRIEEQFIAKREWYEKDDAKIESLKCFDEAVLYGVAAIFYTFPYDD
ncbi:hypothetical protein [Aneurinibacillus tyrosinisolvens]|uniref:hypothetical protein n=1 Tax=Aneurinibacillus tyrosinisolvens TaxID=1443435 RepID=UPI00063F8E76|nr:hypothetical protein [Aneurinibacillus tyrosinisolvens]